MTMTRVATEVEPSPQPEAVAEGRQVSLLGMDELIVFCPRCKTLETLCFADEVLVKTPKFAQRNGKIYHDCGPSEPCRLYRTFRRG